ncbi:MULTISPECIES: 3-hydroxyacyl-CoA dehydrogenase family protein [unclassified Thermoactinomyces]|jgi:3-hydroxybutyryl-CoA dehydrogenase|uniref:3-hydroxyacyl-CoA dehydrogenase family protein n=1 Tax=unclassified Thermoactinomyces TaxID=2634588 RepID=UPI001E319590|nr:MULTISPECIES: 3-hydroxyacyl-CoA dehydrogenase NAD-binding domain-containing protein [unclassified Thermoactinomyces]
MAMKSEGLRIQRPAVIGAGTMGMGIVEVLAGNGFSVQVVELSQDLFNDALQKMDKRLLRRVEKGKMAAREREEILGRIRYVPAINNLDQVDLVIEAVVENLAVKQEVFKDLDACTSPDTILASNTSSLSITGIAAKTTRPERVLGLHFFNPVPRMALVEVVAGMATSPALVEAVSEWIRTLGKEPVKVKDVPGFLVNRVARPFHTEAYRIVQEGTAGKAQVDRIIRSAGFKMGPFELQDLIGIDINYAASVSVYEGYFHDPRFRPHFVQQRMVESGALGRKTGKGHYSYES